ncbi:MAG: ROK family transcriptional regulator [Spirochaetes bacterium]|nr:ROK family transcriptional regulator [Spirochaetota bacterium]
MSPGSSRSALARRLGLRPTTVSHLVQELLDDGLVAERRGRGGTGHSGRPQAAIEPVLERLAAVSLCVESRELRASLVDLAGRVLASDARPVAAGADNQAIEEALEALIGGLAGRAPKASRVVGAGLSLVGTVDPSGLTWVSAARWPRLRALGLGPLADRIGLPVRASRALDTALALLLESDATAADRTVALLHWGFGIGAAVAHRGTLLGSSLGRFGEIGHLRTPGGAGRRCACGARGCLETEAALWALMPRLRRRLGTLPDDEQELAVALAAPGVAALPEVRTAVRAVQDGLVTLHRLFYPDEVFLAGPLAENPAVFRRLADGFAAGLPDYAVGKTSLTALPGGLSACRTRSAGPLLRDALRAGLRRTT